MNHLLQHLLLVDLVTFAADGMLSLRELEGACMRLLTRCSTLEQGPVATVPKGVHEVLVVLVLVLLQLLVLVLVLNAVCLLHPAPKAMCQQLLSHHCTLVLHPCTLVLLHSVFVWPLLSRSHHHRLLLLFLHLMVHRMRSIVQDTLHQLVCHMRRQHHGLHHALPSMKRSSCLHATFHPLLGASPA